MTEKFQTSLDSPTATEFKTLITKTTRTQLRYHERVRIWKELKGGGSKSRSKGGKGDALHKKVSLQTSKEHLTTLRQALRDELGHDRDVVSGFGAFTKYDRNDLALDIHFRTGSTITDDELEWAYELVSSNLGPLGHKWKAQALMDDLCDPSSRYALVTERTASAAAAEKKPASKSKGKKKAPAPPLGKPVAFAHFRFTVQGETREAMEGEPVLMLRDLHVEADYQRKGLGRHLCQLLELSARKNSMRAMMLLVPSGSRARAFPAARSWTESSRGSLASTTSSRP